MLGHCLPWWNIIEFVTFLDNQPYFKYLWHLEDKTSQLILLLGGNLIWFQFLKPLNVKSTLYTLSIYPRGTHFGPFRYDQPLSRCKVVENRKTLHGL